MRRATRPTGRRPGWLWGILLAAAALLISPSRADAFDNQCGDMTHQNSCGAVNSGCICCDSDVTCPSTGLGENHGNCVWYAWEKACRDWGVALTTCTDAHYWDQNNQADGYHIDPDPCPGTIFVCEQNTSECGATNWGHVGWVLDAYPNGTIDIREQGCCWFWGTHNRFGVNAHLASPAMKYIYPPGSTSCVACDCTVGETEMRECPGGCGTEERTCDTDCTWGAWSGCDVVPECEPGASRACGVCGLQICLLDCSWSGCDDRCAGDAGALIPDAGSTGADGGDPTSDGGGSDGGATNGSVTSAGCSCQGDAGGAPGGGTAALALLVALLVLGLRRRARDPLHAPSGVGRRKSDLACLLAGLLALGGALGGAAGCSTSSMGDACQSNDDCDPGYYCSNGTCTYGDPDPDAALTDASVPPADALTTDGEVPCVAEDFPFSDAEETLVVPANAQYMHVKLWGGGGNSELTCPWTDDGVGLDGGQGGFTEAIFEVRPQTALAPGTELVVIVGAAGLAWTVSEFGFGVRGGAGLTGIFLGPAPILAGDADRALAVAGGGGSAGAPGCYAGGPGNHPDAGGRTDMRGGEGSDPEQRIGGGAGYEGGLGGQLQVPGTGGSGFVDDTLTLDHIIHYATPGDNPVPGSTDADYIAHGGTAGLSEQPGLAIIKFVCTPPPAP